MQASTRQSVCRLALARANRRHVLAATAGRTEREPLPLYDATSLALVGASERTAYSVALERNLRRGGFPMERCYFVNPARTQVFGSRCYPALTSIDAPVDLAL